jgi:hypothetical protein
LTGRERIPGRTKRAIFKASALKASIAPQYQKQAASDEDIVSSLLAA